jgi:hypothetical protein
LGITGDTISVRTNDFALIVDNCFRPSRLIGNKFRSSVEIIANLTLGIGFIFVPENIDQPKARHADNNKSQGCPKEYLN